MLSTTVTPSAITNANPRSSPKSCRSLFISDPRAVPQVDGVRELVLTDRAALEAHRKVELERGQTAAPGRVRERGKDVRSRQVVGVLHPARAAGGAELAVEGVAVRRPAHRNGAPTDVPTAAGRKFESHRIRREGRDVRRAMDVPTDLVERETRVQLRGEAAVLLVLSLGAGDERRRDPGEDNAHD